jgi:hypothetical protein
MNAGGGLGAKVVGAKVADAKIVDARIVDARIVDTKMVDAKMVDAKINRFALPRVHVTADMSLSEFEAHVTGFYRSLRRRLLGSDRSRDEDELEAAAP